MTTLLIRTENTSDYETIALVNELAFGQPNEAVLVEKLRGLSSYSSELSFVAELNGEIVAHLLFTKIQIVSLGQSFPSLSLAPIAVLPAFQKQGIGSTLLKKGLDSVSILGYPSVIVLGHPEYYPKFGFLPAETFGVRCPFEVPSEAWMALELFPGALSGVSGEVAYPQPFYEVI